MARGGRFFGRIVLGPLGPKNRFFIVARGPVPRDLSTAAENARSQETTNGCCSDQGMARDRPSPYVKGRRFFFPRYGRITVPSLRRTGAQPPLSGCSGNGNFAASSSSISMPSPGASLAQ